MSEPDRSGQEPEDDETDHPLEEGIQAAEEGDTVSLEDILSEVD